MDYWRRALEEADVPYSMVANFDDVVADRQMAANGVFVEIDDPVLGRVRTVDTPMQIEAHPKAAPARRRRAWASTRGAILAERPGRRRDRGARRARRGASRRRRARGARDRLIARAGIRWATRYLSDLTLVNRIGSAADSVMSIWPSGLIASSIAGATVPVPAAGIEHRDTDQEVDRGARGGAGKARHRAVHRENDDVLAPGP